MWNYGYYGYNGTLLKTLVASVTFADSEVNKVQFFAKLYGIVHALIKGQIDSLKMSARIPGFPAQLTVQCCDGEHKVFGSHCFYCNKTNSIMKFYDPKVKPYLKPNVDLMAEHLSAKI